MAAMATVHHILQQRWVSKIPWVNFSRHLVSILDMVGDSWTGFMVDITWGSFPVFRRGIWRLRAVFRPTLAMVEESNGIFRFLVLLASIWYMGRLFLVKYLGWSKSGHHFPRIRQLQWQPAKEEEKKNNVLSPARFQLGWNILKIFLVLSFSKFLRNPPRLISTPRICFWHPFTLCLDEGNKLEIWIKVRIYKLTCTNSLVLIYNIEI